MAYVKRFVFNLGFHGAFTESPSPPSVSKKKQRPTSPLYQLVKLPPFFVFVCVCYLFPIPSTIYGIFTYNCLIFMVNVGKYTIYGYIWMVLCVCLFFFWSLFLGKIPIMFRPTGTQGENLDWCHSVGTIGCAPWINPSRSDGVCFRVGRLWR